jgi:hypothetical protein
MTELKQGIICQAVIVHGIMLRTYYQFVVGDAFLLVPVISQYINAVAFLGRQGISQSIFLVDSLYLAEIPELVCSRFTGIGIFDLLLDQNVPRTEMVVKGIQLPETGQDTNY